MTLHQPPSYSRTQSARQLYWLAGGLVLFFLIPYVLTDAFTVDRDLYYGIYIGAVALFIAAWLSRTETSRADLLRHNWARGTVLGLAFGAIMVAIVLRDPSTSHPRGAAFAAAIAWRGILYGLADGLILSAFPILAVFAAFSGRSLLRRRGGRVAVAALALAVSMVFTAVYHLGYSDFRGDKLRKPVAGDAIWSVPTLLTASPLASPVAHAALHVSAVVHSYDTGTFLPPHPRSLDGRALQHLLDRAVTGPNRLAPGATAFVAGPDGTWSGAAGLANLSTREPMTASARLRLDSVSKIWTATLIFQLAAERRLHLADTVARWFPNLLPYGNRITIAELLTHTSGLIDNNDVGADPRPYLARVTDPALKATLLETQRLLAREPATRFSPRLWIRLAAYQPLLSPPGTQYHYSNIGFEILGLIAARAGGADLATLYRERIFAPLHLASAAYDPQGPIAGPHAHGYMLGTGAPRDGSAVHGGIGAEGGIVADARDTARFLTGLMTGKLVDPTAVERMQTGAFWNGGEPTTCGGAAFGHSGASAAFKSNVWVSGDGRRVAVLLLNGRGGDATDARAGEVLNRLYCLTQPA